MKSTCTRVVVAMLIGLGVVVTSAPASYAATTCLGQPATWEGTEGDDTTTGTNGDDVFVGLGGHDTVDGRGGDDLFCLGDGNDVATGGDGTNHFVDGEGYDTYWGNPTDQADVIDYSTSLGTTVNLQYDDVGEDDLHDIHAVIGSPGNDRLVGDAQNNRLVGGGGDDAIMGLSGNDEIHGGAGDDTVDGSLGDDIITGDGGADWVISGPGDDSMVGASSVGEPTDHDLLIFEFSAAPVQVSLTDGTATGEGSDTISGFTTIWGSDHADVITGDDQSNYLDGGKGDDVLDGAGGDDVLVGDDGYNTASFASAPNGVTVNVDTATGDGTDTLIRVAEVTGSPYDDTLRVGAYAVAGMAGNDTLLGGALRFDGGPGDDTVMPSWGAGQIATGDGIDTVSFETMAQGGVQVDLSTGQATGTGINTTFVDLPEVLIGSPYDDVLTGSTGADILKGLGGADLVRPGEGDDQVDTGAGNDTVDFAGATHAIVANLMTGTASGEGKDTLSGVENLNGSSYSDTLRGNLLANAFLGRAGNDRMTGLGGADRYAGGVGLDTVDFGGAHHPVTADLTDGMAYGEGADTTMGIERLIGSTFADTLLGNALANILLGGPGSDLLNGRGGRDSLFGNTGPDLLVGGPGTDSCSGGPDADRASACEATSSVP